MRLEHKPLIGEGEVTSQGAATDTAVRTAAEDQRFRVVQFHKARSTTVRGPSRVLGQASVSSVSVGGDGASGEPLRETDGSDAEIAGGE